MSAKITQGGRLVIPAAIRKAMQIEDGEVVVLEMSGQKLEVVALRERLKEVQEACAGVLAGGGVVDEFLAERRREAARESD
jgi:AbrB family looped-hinge helix DNA binding protein